MMDIDFSLFSLGLAIAIILLTIAIYVIKNKGIPPGPVGVPYLGMYPFLQHNTFHLQLTDYVKKYGEIFSFTYTGRLFFNLGSVKTIKAFQMGQSDNITRRFTDFSILSYILGEGVTMIDGEAWKVLKKFFSNNFKEYGLLEPRDGIVQSLLEELNAKRGMPLDLVEILTQKCMSTMRRTVFGENGLSEEKTQEFLQWHGKALDNLSGVNIMLIGPIARLLYYWIPANYEAIKLHLRIRKLFLNTIQKIESTSREEAPTCIVENYYKEKKDKLENNDPTWKHYTDMALVCSLAQFVGDGTLGTATFAAGFLNALIDNPEEQDKIYDELIEVVGLNRQPTVEDRSKLPYTTAFMFESVRISNFFPMFPSLEFSEESTLYGYRIPKGSITLLNFWAAHHDPMVYKDPFKFYPSRFISTPDHPKEELPVQFGVGKRYCNGESYVMLEAFTYLTAIVKNFKILPAGDPAKVSQQFLRYAKLEVYLEPRDV